MIQFAVRAADVILASFALLFLAPLMIVVAVLVTLQDGGPALFGHRRIGRAGLEFNCLKFRSMVVDAEERLTRHLAANASARLEWAADHKLRHDPRVTALGRFLRKSSIDELPQLFNVLRGDMSLVGPRPIVQGEVHRYGRYFAHYCQVRPGITGLWQVMGRNDVSYRRRVALDVAYVRRFRVTTYVSILALTVPAVLGRSGVY
ncbi:UDP-glucose:undecaprenyl-phosphate glucose-1-phosphate transferase [Brevundimonas subvibrioides]|uniref:sugar transferase n=1 Tax=Brevundimonas subvibrioides TaxID=74313 RepID=UPI0032D57039